MDVRHELKFHEQLDGKIVSFIGRKCVIADRDLKAKLKPGQVWLTRVEDKGTFFIGFPERLVREESPHTRPASVGLTLGDVAPELGKIAPAKPTVTPAAVVPAKPVAPAPPVDRATKVEVVEPLGRATTLGGMTLEPDNVIRHEDRVAFFVDAANTDNACAHAGFLIDWQKALAYFVGNGLFGGAYYFTTNYMHDEQEQRRYHDRLAHYGFTVREKRVKIITDRKTGEERVKGNVDIELALEMIAREKTYDVAILFSGDSDFERVLLTLQSRGKRVFVVTSRESAGRELLQAADKPVFFLEDFHGVLERPSVTT